MKKLNLDWMLQNSFGLYHTDLNLLEKWREPYEALNEGYSSTDIEYVHGGFILSWANERWYNILVVDKEKFKKVKEQLLPHVNWKRALTEHNNHFYKYELDNLETAIYTWKLNIKDEFTETLKEFLEKELYYWFDNFGRNGYNYKSKFKGYVRKEMRNYKKKCFV